MIQIFDYESTAGGYPIYRNKSSYSDSNWETLIKNELDSGKPMIKNGCSDSGCHAWNLDGYDEDMTFI